MDVRALDCAHAGLRLQHYEEYELVLPMAAADYLDYVLTETNVERALRAGVSERSVREWCERGLAPIFGANPLPIAFTGYFACLDRA